ncbi:MAG: T9SS type A sorting domain-containing protein [Flavobacteriales bacterium]|nr:MAG: T9SS type A sorting domain-containing protein [Flavobacteriales bacterium]
MRITTAPFLLFAAHAIGQITLVPAEHDPLIGTGFSVNTGTYIAPGSAGAGLFWDFSALSATGSDELQFVDPATTPNGADFTTATIAMVDNDGNYSYFQSDATGFTLVGNDDGAIAFPLSDGAKYWPFPCDYSDTWNDILAGTIVIAGQNVTRAGTIEGIADGYGDLGLPWGTVYGVLRVALHEEYQDATPLGTVVHDVMTHRFFTRFLPFPVLQITDASTTVNGSTTTSQTTQWVDSTVVGLFEARTATTASLVLWPNPASGMVTMSTGDTEVLRVEVTDATGRLVLSVPYGSATRDPGNHRLDVSTLCAGSYVVSTVGSSGRRSSTRLLVR